MGTVIGQEEKARMTEETLEPFNSPSDEYRGIIFLKIQFEWNFTICMLRRELHT